MIHHANIEEKKKEIKQPPLFQQNKKEKKNLSPDPVFLNFMHYGQL